MEVAPKVFISYAHTNKLVARRLLRRLTAHGIKVWLDERELRVGAALTSSIRTQIEAVDVLLVIASQASADSIWVGLEIDFALKHAKTVIPLFIEALDKHERFRNFLGVNATSPQTFADVVHGVMQDLFVSLDQELPPPDTVVLTDGLRAFALEEPNLAPLIHGCLDFGGLHYENVTTVYTAPFHALDEALNALYDIERSEKIAYHLASGFSQAGAGTRALSLWIKSTGNGGGPLVSAVGSRTVTPSLIPTCITLLAVCNPPNDHAVYMFIHHNATQFDEVQRRSVIRLATWPVRSDASGMADVLGWVAWKHFPDALEIQQMWTRWIHNGAFDGNGKRSPAELARYLADADEAKLRGLEEVSEALRSHVRACLRSGDKQKVMAALDHIKAAADANASVLNLLLNEANGVSSTYEWDQWRKQDPDTADRMAWLVHEMTKEATGDKNWLRAWDNAKLLFEYEKQRMESLSKNEQPSD